MSKHSETNSMQPYSWRAFQSFQEHDKRCHGSGQTNKQTTFLHRYIFMNSLLGKRKDFMLVNEDTSHFKK